MYASRSQRGGPGDASDVRAEVEAGDVSWRDAAYVVALKRVGEAKAARGPWP